MKRIILPKIQFDNLDEALIFLAGPINNAPSWQDKAIEIIHSINDKIYIASPSKELRNEYLNEAIKGEIKFEKQLDWERHYLELASVKGAIMFYLPLPIRHDCNRSYARDTRGELGEWRGRLCYDTNIKIIIGAQEGFDGLDIIKRNYQAINQNMKFYQTLEETCKETINSLNYKIL